MDSLTQSTLLKLRDDLMYFQRRAEEIHTEIVAILTRNGLKELRVGIVSTEDQLPSVAEKQNS